MTDNPRAGEQPIPEKLVVGDILRPMGMNDGHTVVAVTDDRVWMQVDGATGEGGQLREFGFDSFRRKGFSYAGVCEDDVELCKYLDNYTKEVLGVDSPAAKTKIKEATEEEDDDGDSDEDDGDSGDSGTDGGDDGDDSTSSDEDGDDEGGDPVE